MYFLTQVYHLYLWGFSHWKNEVGTIAAASARLFYVLLHVSFQFFSCVSLFMCVFMYLAFCFMLLVSLDAVAAVKDRQELTTRTTLMPHTKQVSPIQAIPGSQKHEHYNAQIQQLQLETTYASIDYHIFKQFYTTHRQLSLASCINFKYIWLILQHQINSSE